MQKKVFGLAVFLILSWGGPLQANTKEKIDQIVRHIEKQYSLTLLYTEVPETSWNLRYKIAKASDYPALYKYLTLFEEEFFKYPAAFVKATQLKKIVFVKQLGLQSQARAAIPDYYKKTLLYDFEAGNKYPTYQRHVVHHEYYHMIEFVSFGSAYYKDAAWAGFNEKNFQYGSGGYYMRNSTASTYNHCKKGFVNQYSTSGLEEDKAEMFATLFISSELEKTMGWIKEGDEILKKKMEYMKNFLKKLCSEMDEKYWAKLHEKKMKKAG